MTFTEAWMTEQHDALALFIQKVADDPSLQARLEAEGSDPITLAKEMGISLEAKALELVYGDEENQERELDTKELADVAGGFAFKLSGKNFLKGLNLTTKTVSNVGFNMAGSGKNGCPISYPTCCGYANGFNAMATISQ